MARQIPFTKMHGLGNDYIYFDCIKSVLPMVLLPVVGIVLYIFFGRSLRHVRMISRKKRLRLTGRDDIKHLMRGGQVVRYDTSLSERQQMINLVNSIQGSPYLPNNEVEIFTNGKDKFAAYKRDLLAAKRYIHIQYYIIENDKLGNEIAEILKQKVGEGVKVIFMNGYTSTPALRSFLK